MSEILAQLQELVRRGEVQVARHGFRELAADGIVLDDIIAGIEAAILVEDHPSYAKGPQCWSSSETARTAPFMCFGAFQKTRRRQLLWLRLIDRTLGVGLRILRGEKEHIRKTVEIIHEGKYAAEVPVDLIEDDTGWSPYLSVEDAASSMRCAWPCASAILPRRQNTAECSN